MYKISALIMLTIQYKLLAEWLSLAAQDLQIWKCYEIGDWKMVFRGIFNLKKSRQNLTEVINNRVVCPVYGQIWIWPFSLPFDTHNEIFWSPEYFHQILSGFGDIGQSFKMPKMGPKMENQQLIGQFSYEILKIGVYDLVWAVSWWPKPKRSIRPRIGRFGRPPAV